MLREKKMRERKKEENEGGGDELENGRKKEKRKNEGGGWGGTGERKSVRTMTRGSNGPQNVTQLTNDHPSRMKVMLQ